MGTHGPHKDPWGGDGHRWTPVIVECIFLPKSNSPVWQPSHRQNHCPLSFQSSGHRLDSWGLTALSLVSPMLRALAPQGAQALSTRHPLSSPRCLCWVSPQLLLPLLGFPAAPAASWLLTIHLLLTLVHLIASAAPPVPFTTCTCISGTFPGQPAAPLSSSKAQNKPG